MYSENQFEKIVSYLYEINMNLEWIREILVKQERDKEVNLTKQQGVK